MPIDRHTSGDDFDRSDDARVNESEQQAEAHAPDGRKTAVSQAKSGKAKAGRKGTSPKGKARSARATDKMATKTTARRTARSRASNTAQSK